MGEEGQKNTKKLSNKTKLYYVVTSFGRGDGVPIISAVGKSGKEFPWDTTICSPILLLVNLKE